MLLALDVGNTNLTAGVFAGRKIVKRWRCDTSALSFPKNLDIDACVYGSVVPAVNLQLERAVHRLYGCRAIGITASNAGLKVRVKKPSQVGADRLLNALAAYERAQGAAVVLDFGTATTFDCVAADGAYIGGAILLGPNLAADALHRRTAKLPLVPVSRPRRIVGKDTVECIQAGLYFGYLGMIEKVLRLTLAELGGKPRLFATGGLAGLFKHDLPKRMTVAPDLTLEGLRIAWERMKA